MMACLVMTVMTVFPAKVFATEYQNHGEITFTEGTVESTGSSDGTTTQGDKGPGSLPNLSEFVRHNYVALLILLIVFLWLLFKRKERNHYENE